MQKLFIVGNLTRDPELRTTPSGKSVCNFTVAVNRRRKVDGQPDADFFRVTVWENLAENCAKYLAKGRKVALTGEVSVRTYQTQDGQTRAELDVSTNDVEFLTPKGDSAPAESAPAESYPKVDAQTGFANVETDELPF